MEDGSLIDTTLNQTIPKNKDPMPRTTSNQVCEHRVISSGMLEQIVIREGDYPWQDHSALAKFDGVEEAPLLGPANPQEGLDAGPLSWEHGFVFRVVRLLPGAEIPAHTRFEEEVIFVQSGLLLVVIEGSELEMKPGDVFTTPISASRSFKNSGPQACEFFVTRRNDLPHAPSFDNGNT